MPILATKGASSAQGFGFAGAASFICATGGTITTCGNYRIHTFTGPGSFVVSKAPGANSTVDYLVVAGGGGAPVNPVPTGARGGGGGAGGYRESKQPTAPWTASPLATTTGITVSTSPGTYPITVGAGGVDGYGLQDGPRGGNGGNSVFSTITSTGGGGGGSGGGAGTPPCKNGAPGGSGGGNGMGNSFGYTIALGNTPPTSPPQGNDAAPSNQTQPNVPNNNTSGGGGGAGSAGCKARPENPLANSWTLAGDGTGTAIAPASGTSGPSPTLKYFAGGGAGSSEQNLTCSPTNNPQQKGGFGGGGNAVSAGSGGASAGTANTGGGGGAGPGGGTGGSGIVVIRYRYK